MAIQKNVKIKNRRARFEYEILDTYTAGIVLRGTEIKAIREGKASIAESFCEFSNGELFVINMTIQEYSHATHYSHTPKSERKLLLNRSELNRRARALAMGLFPDLKAESLPQLESVFLAALGRAEQQKQTQKK